MTKVTRNRNKGTQGHSYDKSKKYPVTQTLTQNLGPPPFVKAESWISLLTGVRVRVRVVMDGLPFPIPVFLPGAPIEIEVCEPQNSPESESDLPG